MEKAFRISVRELVAFCFPPEDITPGGTLGDMLLGGAAHRAAQKKREGEIEKSLNHTFELEGCSLELFGRMDAYTDGDIPLVEEMKHCRTVPGSVYPEHRAQAVCYAAMVALQKPCHQICICISYLSAEGDLLFSFQETLAANAAVAELQGWLHIYLAFALQEEAHKEKRNASLKALAFPFPAYRSGQRELARQVYTAISRKRRLFASLPTGTGKSAAVLFPALKALGEGKTGRILYLTARNTARQSPLDALERMQAQGMHARISVLTAKEKLCPAPARCHPDDCSRASGHYLRERDAVAQLLAQGGLWNDEVIVNTAETFHLCPFELALTLTGLADITLMDLNYAFDPFAQLKRLFRERRDMTLLVDEAHHTVERVRESLTGELDSGFFKEHRTAVGKVLGRKHPYYKALSALLTALRSHPAQEGGEWCEKDLPEGLCALVETVQQEATALLSVPKGISLPDVFQLLRICMPFLYAAGKLAYGDHAILWSARGKERTVCLYCLSPADEIARITGQQSGTVFFSATLSPLGSMKQLLGGEEEDACFSLPSPFPPENLRVYMRSLSTRYNHRADTAEAIAQLIAEMVNSKAGNYIVFFPSYAYLRLVRLQLNEALLPPLWVQEPQMEEADREAFFRLFQDGTPHLALCVLGGLFSEGIDLPGDRLIGAMVVGVGLPTPSQKQTAIQCRYEELFGNGFHYACRIPGMQKVLQAGGRIIRSEQDTGVLVLVDDRYMTPPYRALLPDHWHISAEASIRHPESKHAKENDP